MMEDTEEGSMKRHLQNEGRLSRSRLSYMWAITVAVFKYTDTDAIRVLLANASFLWTGGLLWDVIFGAPGRYTFDRSGFYYMAQFGGEIEWATVFFIHGMGVYLTVFWKTPTWFAVTTNALGLAVWLASTVAIDLAVGSFSPGTSMEWTMCVAAGWSLYRTEIKHEKQST